MSISRFIQRSTLSVSIVTLASLGITTSPSEAASVDFSTWEKFGDVLPQPGLVFLTNDAIQQDDDPKPSGFYNVSGQPAGEASPNPDLQAFLGLGDSALDIDGQAFEGSAIKSLVTVEDGGKFSFDWSFSTQETVNKDFGFFFVNNRVFKLADYTNASFANSYTYNFRKAGTYTIGFGVVDIDDYTTSSTFLLTKANLETVPEPLTILGSLTALGFGVGMRRLRKKMSA
ncbi:MAG: PEP-CTERM sorting domain-containing protein [Desmonostoc vinosum HA7617-LM4]|jgi:hypothetical protein|nr:PEP-CTERM sorting domain-containing protein [Desmonostoc vinosum HA7617-LM4]